jgi:hypothetical protein
MDAEAEHLADAIEEALPRWVVGSVERVLVAWPGRPEADAMAAAARAGRRAAAEVGAEVRELLATDVDEQRSTPLTLLRAAVRYPTEVLRQAGVPPVERDPFDAGHFPDDPYALTPMSFADVDPALHEPGLRWGAMKAGTHLRRRRGEGRA